MKTPSSITEGKLLLLAQAARDDRLNELTSITPQAADDSTFEPTPEACVAAFNLVQRLGECDFCNVDPTSVVPNLSLAMAITAAEELLGRINQWTDQARNLNRDWWESTDFESEDLCCSLLENRMAALGMFRVLDQADQASHAENGFESNRLHSAIDELMEATEDFDNALLAQAVILSTVTKLPLFDNWRNELCEELQGDLPWWLDGTIDELAEESDRLAQRWFPPRSPNPQAHFRRSRDEEQIGSSSSQRHLETRPPVGMGAALGRPVSLPELLEWRSPNGQLMARLRVPKVKSQDLLSLRIYLRTKSGDYVPTEDIQQRTSASRAKAGDFSFENISIAQVAPHAVRSNEILFSLAQLESSPVWKWAVLVVDGVAWPRVIKAD